LFSFPSSIRERERYKGEIGRYRNDRGREANDREIGRDGLVERDREETNRER